jgi:tripartite ATP-independent transporter DctM subunit
MELVQLTVLLLPMLFLMGLGMSIFLAMGISCALFVFMFDLPNMILAKSYVTGLATYDFLALPFYFVAGDLMGGGGITGKLVQFAQAFIGHIRGGLSHVTIVAGMIFAGVSGSATADASAIGSVLMPSMKKSGYPAPYIAALNAATATLGPIIPPSIPCVIYALIAHLSVGKLFMAGAVPGIMMGGYLLVVSFYLSYKRGYPATKRATFREIIKTTVTSFPALIMPVIILGGIISGIVTPTEAGVVAVVYALIVGNLVYKGLKLRDVPRIFGDAMINSAVILIIIATSGLFGWIIANMGLGAFLVKFFLSITTNKWVILGILNIVFLLWGCFLDSLMALIIVIPVLLPMIQQVGIDPVHFGLVVIINLGLGLLTPPVGTLLYLCTKMAGANLMDVIKEMVPFLIALVIALGLFTYVPQIVLWLPNLLGYR